LPTESRSDCRADKEQHCHVCPKHNANGADGVDNCGYIGDIKLVGAIKIKVSFEFVHKYLPSFHDTIISHLLVFVNIFLKKFFYGLDVRRLNRKKGKERFLSPFPLTC
jgi:hypothetical protein